MEPLWDDRPKRMSGHGVLFLKDSETSFFYRFKVPDAFEETFEVDKINFYLLVRLRALALTAFLRFRR